jgi:hypothetical protein
MTWDLIAVTFFDANMAAHKRTGVKSIGHQLISPAGTMAGAPLALMQRRYIYRAAIQRSAEIASQAFGE